MVRLEAIDRVRGLVMVLMALDHVRDYFTNAHFDPLDLSQTSSALFFTRWVTHLCAPTFILLAGVSARLLGERVGRPRLSRFLLTRGVWLVALELTVVNWVWSFNFRYETGFTFQVIWAIGVSMLLLAPLVYLPAWLVGTFGALLCAGHNLLDPVQVEGSGAAALGWRFLHVSGRVPLGFIVYPLIPWVGVMALGFALGAVYRWPAPRRQALLWRLGLASLIAFGLLRLVNGYGDPMPWSPQASRWFTFLSFLDVHKYPPSLAYVLVMGGLGCLLLAAFEAWPARGLAPLCVFGRVPLFFYVMHMAALHALAGVVALAMGQGTGVLTHSFMGFPPQWGVSLPWVYVAWAVVVVALYPVCHWFAELKRSHAANWWMSYL